MGVVNVTQNHPECSLMNFFLKMTRKIHHTWWRDLKEAQILAQSETVCDFVSENGWLRGFIMFLSLCPTKSYQFSLRRIEKIFLYATVLSQACSPNKVWNFILILSTKQLLNNLWLTPEQNFFQKCNHFVLIQAEISLTFINWGNHRYFPPKNKAKY